MSSYYKSHLFFCTNQRASGKQCCAQGDAEKLATYAKQQLKKRDLYGPGKYRVTLSGCLGRCEEGPIAVAYPQGNWCSYKTYTDIDQWLAQVGEKEGA